MSEDGKQLAANVDFFLSATQQLKRIGLALAQGGHGELSQFVQQHVFQLAGIAADRYFQTEENSRRQAAAAAGENSQNLFDAVCELRPGAENVLATIPGVTPDLDTTHLLASDESPKPTASDATQSGQPRNGEESPDAVLSSSPDKSEAESLGSGKKLNKREIELGNDVEERMQARQKAHAAWRSSRYARESVLFDCFVAITAENVEDLEFERDNLAESISDLNSSVHSPFVPLDQRPRRQHGESSFGDDYRSDSSRSSSPRIPSSGRSGVRLPASVPAPRSRHAEPFDADDPEIGDYEDDSGTEYDFYDDETSSLNSSLAPRRKRIIGPKIDADIRVSLQQNALVHQSTFVDRRRVIRV